MPYEIGPYDSAHIYVQWGGKLPGGEQWTCGFRMAGPPANAETAPAGMLANIGAALVAYHQNINTGISARALLSFVKVNGVGTDGQYINDSTTQALYADLPAGGSVANTPANQVCLAVSLTTGYSRGPAHRGRFYLPLPVFALDANGVYAAANAISCSATADTLLSAVNAVSPDWKMADYSRKKYAPAHRLVTGNLVGRVYDTQRRRRRSLVENYQ
jgi:hypothetical protein